MSSVITRQRRKRRNVRGLMLPVLALGALAAAIAWPPSRNWFTNGPLHPVWAFTAPFFNQAVQPLHWAAQNQLIADKNREIRKLEEQLEANRQTINARDEEVKNVQNQLKNTLAQISNATPSPAPLAAGNAAAPQAGAPGAVAQNAPSSSDIARTASYWNSMDPEKAAAVVKKLPVEYVSKVFAKMPPDQVAEIMNSLAPADAAKFAGAVPIPAAQ